MNAKGLLAPIRRYDWFLVPVGLAGLNAFLWAAFATLGGNPVMHGDSYEAYVWGREFQLGYYKHPPFWAWIAGGWFSLFPHADWLFFLLAEANAALGVIGTWALLGRFTKGPERLAGTLLLLLTTFYTFNALRFNANTIQLSIWPWTMYFFVLSIEKKTAAAGAVLGLMAGVAVLSKYFAAVLILSCILAALIHRDRLSYLRSPAPWVAILTFGVVVTPHLLWVIQHNYQPFVYAARQTAHPKTKFVYTWIGFLVTCALYHLLQFVVILTARSRQNVQARPSPAIHIRHGLAFLSVLALAPLALILIVRLFGWRVAPFYVIPIFSLTPFLLLLLLGADARSVARSSAWIYGVIVTISLVAAPFVPALAIWLHKPAINMRQVSLAAVDEWQKTTHTPLHLVSGSQPYSKALTFYAPGDVSEFTEFNLTYAPWVTEQRIKQQGLLVICLTQDHWCLENAAPYEIIGTKTIQMAMAPQWGSLSGPEVAFTIIMIPPATK